MNIGIHQPNFCPTFPYFVKMELADRFVILNHVQFSKTGYQNYQNLFGGRWTNPVNHGNITIKDKTYTTGQNLAQVNLHLIRSIAMLLNIDTSKIVTDYPTELTKTERLVDILVKNNATGYISNPKAPEKYLDLEQLKRNNIEFLPFVCNEQRHPFELFTEFGIETTRAMMLDIASSNRRAWKKLGEQNASTGC